MSASGVRIRLRLFALFCITISTALCQEKSSVIWKNRGESVTITCIYNNNNNDELQNIYVKKGIHKDTDFFFKSKKHDTTSCADNVRGRVQINDNFPKIDILLTNLTTDDSGVYWCLYQKYDTNFKTVTIDGEGSMLLVVTDPVVVTDKSTSQECEQPNKNLVVTSVVISATVLLTIMMVLLLLVIRKVKSSSAQDKPRPIPNNDVYEDMRGTIRR